MTRSQQELSFESSETQNSNSDEHLETLTVASPSRVLQRQSLLIRQSKGNPLYAKPVGIPVVPALPKQELPALSPPLNKMETKPPVSPHKINNFVYEEDNRIILGTEFKPDLFDNFCHFCQFCVQFFLQILELIITSKVH